MVPPPTPVIVTNNTATNQFIRCFIAFCAGDRQQRQAGCVRDLDQRHRNRLHVMMQKKTAAPLPRTNPE
jgi:hypothetical protein